MTATEKPDNTSPLSEAEPALERDQVKWNPVNRPIARPTVTRRHDHVSEKNDHALVRRALTYPFDLAEGSFVLCAGDIFPLVAADVEDPRNSRIVVSEKIHSLADEFTRRIGHPMAKAGWVPVLASGSNASPVRLLEKFGDVPGATVLVVKGAVTQLVSVYSAHITRYGSISATLQHVEGARAHVFCLLVPQTLLPLLHKSEALGMNYDFYRLEGAQFETQEGATIGDLHAYLSRWGSLQIDGQNVGLAAFRAAGVTGPVMAQGDVMARVHGLLSPGETLHRFILTNIKDDALRKQRIKRLSRDHAQPVAADFFRRID